MWVFFDSFFIHKNTHKYPSTSATPKKGKSNMLSKSYLDTPAKLPCPYTQWTFDYKHTRTHPQQNIPRNYLYMIITPPSSQSLTQPPPTLHNIITHPHTPCVRIFLVFPSPIKNQVEPNSKMN